MDPIKNILVYLPAGPGEAAVLERAGRIAAVNGADVEIVDVVDELPMTLRTPAFGYPALSKTLKEETFARLEAAAKKVRSQQVSVSVKSLYGKDFLEITKEAMRGGHDLVLLHANPGDKAPMRLFRTCPAPVWAVHDNPTGPFKKVLAAVDPLFSADQDNHLNRRILDAAQAAASLESAELHVVHAWGESVEPRKLLESYAKEIQDAARAALDELLKPYGDAIPAKHVHLVPGRPADAIQKLVDDEEIGLLVLGTVVRTGLEGFFIGNTAESLLGEVDCSILALKPEGFRSPVDLD